MNFCNMGTGKIERIASTEASRYSIEHAFLDVDAGHLAATNGHAMALSTVNVDPRDVSGYLPTDALNAYRAALAKVPSWQESNHKVRLYAEDERVIVEDNDGGTRTFPRPQCPKDDKGRRTFPNYAAVMPKDRGDQPAFSLDFDTLKRLVDALGYAETTHGRSAMISFFPARNEDGSVSAEGSVIVKTWENGPIGLIMPMKPNSRVKWLTTIEGLDARLAVLQGKPLPKPEPLPEVEEEWDPDEGVERVSEVDKPSGRGLRIVARKEQAAA